MRSLIVVFLAAAAAAQTITLRQGESITLPECPRPSNSGQDFGRRQLDNIGDAEKTAPYWAAVTAGAATAYIDAWSTEKLFQIRPKAYEASSPWLYGRRPGAARMYATVTAETAAVATLTHLLKRSHKRYWFAPEAYSIGTHALGAANNVLFIRKDHGF
jgi:hypothetical protein